MRLIFAFFIFGILYPITPRADQVPPWPVRSTLESGDFLWPKKPGVFVPYASGGDTSAQDAKRTWLKERDEFVRNPQKIARLSPEDIHRLELMSFEQFYSRYVGDTELGHVELYSSESPFAFVGHVAIVDVDSQSRIWVVEAGVHGGVTRQSYDEWLKHRRDNLIWQGRIKGYSRKDRARVALEAEKYVGRPYDFWNFDLDDDSGFYCSKLAWLSAIRALKIALDGNPNAKRQFWLSPKQLLKSKTIVKLHNPGNYSVP